MEDVLQGSHAGPKIGHGPCKFSAILVGDKYTHIYIIYSYNLAVFLSLPTFPVKSTCADLRKGW